MRNKGVVAAVAVGMLSIVAACGGSDSGSKTDTTAAGTGGSPTTAAGSGGSQGGGSGAIPACPDPAAVGTALGVQVSASIGGSGPNTDLVICPYTSSTGKGANVSFFLAAADDQFDGARAQHADDPDFRTLDGVGSGAFLYSNANTDEPDLISGVAKVGDVTVTVKSRSSFDQVAALLKVGVAQVR